MGANKLSIADMLDNTKWGKDFTRQEVDMIAKYMSLQHYKEGEHIFEQGDRQNFMAFIVEGKVDIIKESADSLEMIVVTLLPRTYFGEMSFVDDEPRSASAVARGPVTLLFLTTENFERISDDYPKLAFKVMRNIAKIISQRLRMTTGKLVYTRA